MTAVLLPLLQVSPHNPGFHMCKGSVLVGESEAQPGTSFLSSSLSSASAWASAWSPLEPPHSPNSCNQELSIFPGSQPVLVPRALAPSFVNDNATLPVMPNSDLSQSMVNLSANPSQPYLGLFPESNLCSPPSLLNSGQPCSPCSPGLLLQPPRGSLQTKPV
jgi:hypothetical protein